VLVTDSTSPQPRGARGRSLPT